MTKRQAKALDTQIEQIISTHCSGVQIPMLSIGKIFAAGRAAAAGEHIETAVLAAVATVRAN